MPIQASEHSDQASKQKGQPLQTQYPIGYIPSHHQQDTFPTFHNYQSEEQSMLYSTGSAVEF